jgi:hypothetical protein
VAAAGDVNGDGYSDVIIGAPGATLDELNEGRAFLYCGNHGPCRAILPRQQLTDGVTPIVLLGRSNSETGFRIRAIMLSIYGHTRMQMEHEVKRVGALFDGLNTVTGDYFDVGDDGAIELDQLVSVLSPDTPYHWRVRAKYELTRTPLQRNGPWLHVPVNGWNEADLRTAGPPVSVPDDAGPSVAAHFEILPGGPNPAIGRCEVLLALGRPARIQADVLDVSGRRIAVLAENITCDQGSHRLVWDGRTRSGSEAAAGSYFIRVRSEDETRVRKAILTR